MKRRLATLATFGLTSALAFSCGGSDEAATTDDPKKQEEEAKKKEEADKEEVAAEDAAAAASQVVANAVRRQAVQQKGRQAARPAPAFVQGLDRESVNKFRSLDPVIQRNLNKVALHSCKGENTCRGLIIGENGRVRFNASCGGASACNTKSPDVRKRMIDFAKRNEARLKQDLGS